MIAVLLESCLLEIDLERSLVTVLLRIHQSYFVADIVRKFVALLFIS